MERGNLMVNQSSKRTNFLKQLFNKNSELTYFKNNGEKGSDDHFLLDYYSSLAVFHPDLILVFSPEADLLSQNRDSINHALGYLPRKKLDYKKLLSEETYSILRIAFKNTLKGKSERHEVAVKNKQGQFVNAVLTFIPIKTPNDRIEGVYIIIKDVTEYRELSQKLELSEKHLTHAQEVAALGSWEYYIDEDRLYSSDNFSNIFGYNRNEAVSMEKPFEFVHPDDYEQTYQTVYNSMKTRSDYSAEFRIFHGKTKELRYIKVQAEVTKKDNKPYKMVGVIKDVTQQKQLEIGRAHV